MRRAPSPRILREATPLASDCRKSAGSQYACAQRGRPTTPVGRKRRPGRFAALAELHAGMLHKLDLAASSPLRPSFRRGSVPAAGRFVLPGAAEPLLTARPSRSNGWFVEAGEGQR